MKRKCPACGMMVQIQVRGNPPTGWVLHTHGPKGDRCPGREPVDPPALPKARIP